MSINELTPDEALEETADQDYGTDVGYRNVLPEDNDRPFKPADDPQGATIPIDHPNTDSDVDLHEQYDAGVPGASGYTTQDGDSLVDKPEKIA